MSLRSIERVGCVAAAVVVGLVFAIGVAGQGKPPVTVATTKPLVVTQLNIAGLKKAITPNGKPLLVNFWATWCDPCREEFPDLVKLDGEYKGKIDFITISLDDLVEINRDVPKFLVDMRADMPAFLLKAEDDDAAIALVSKNFVGALPFTILYKPDGTESYFRQGKVKMETVRAELDKLLTTPTAAK
ncbi:MAG TPA: TlpA disulfide reductase family protein [Pyrinomonadaceae bacterium]|nr:TlpA disulfide reductase family protein [Pyrinomonadaceae bacterium]